MNMLGKLCLTFVIFTSGVQGKEFLHGLEDEHFHEKGHVQAGLIREYTATGSMYVSAIQRGGSKRQQKHAPALTSLERSPSFYHDFLCKNGYSFRGRIVAYDLHTDIVKIECADNRLIKTSPAVFDEADQLRIKDWHTSECFRSKSQFKISAGRKAVKGKKWSTSSWGIGNSGSSGYIRNIHYDIVMENRSVITLRNMTVEYRIYYSSKQFKGVKCGQFSVQKIAPKCKAEVRTSQYIPSRLNSSTLSSGTKAVVDGIWIRITLPLSNDRKVVREYCCPGNLSKHYQWATANVPIGLN